MKLKKMLASAAALAVSATMCLSFVACGGNEDDGDKHTHAYGEWVINKLPTQKEAGSASKYCANDAAHEHDITATLPILTEAARDIGLSAIPQEGKPMYWKTQTAILRLKPFPYSIWRMRLPRHY